MLNYLFQDFKERQMPRAEVFIRLFIDRGASAVFIYRLSSWFWHHKLRFLAELCKQLNICVNSCDISYQAEIGKGLRIFHALGLVIADCKIGENFSVYQNVTIGKNGHPDEFGRYTPNIGNNVTFYTGCVVIGPISINSNVRIGANAVVLKDVPPNATAVGVPANIITGKVI